MNVITVVLGLVGIYAVIGAIFAVVFVKVGVTRIDDAAKSSTLGFKLLIFPGAAALWPVLLIRWLGTGKGVTQ